MTNSDKYYYISLTSQPNTLIQSHHTLHDISGHYYRESFCFFTHDLFPHSFRCLLCLHDSAFLSKLCAHVQHTYFVRTWCVFEWISLLFILCHKKEDEHRQWNTFTGRSRVKVEKHLPHNSHSRHFTDINRHTERIFVSLGSVPILKQIKTLQNTREIIENIRKQKW